MWQAVTAFLISLIGSVVLARTFRKCFTNFKSRERKEGKEKIHRTYPQPRKPLGGGLAMLVAISVGVLIAVRQWGPVWCAFLVAIWGYGLIGLADDLGKMRGRGIRYRHKVLAQVVVALVLGLYLRQQLQLGELYLPLIGNWYHLSWGYLGLVALVMVAASNAVNLADGIDGLAAGSVAIAALIYLALVSVLGLSQLPVLSAAILGGVIGFLVYNYPPAKLIMGDTGSLALGASLGMLALLSRTEWLLIPIGAVFVLGAASVLAQTGAIKFFRRPVRLLRHRTTEIFRPFLCTPIHHHFQWLAWDEKKILALFWGTGAVLGLAGLISYWSDYLWLATLIAMVLWLAAASLQKMIRANFFLGLQLAGRGGTASLALFKGLPAQILGRKLHQVCKSTPITEEMLSALAAESILWRPISEIEASVVLGKIYAEHKMYDEAIREWEEVPIRNLLLRENVVSQLGKLYYARDQLFKAIQLWEQLPESRLERMANLRRAVRSAKIRLVQLAGKSYHQVMDRGQEVAGLPQVDRVRMARGLNHDLLSLLIYEREKLQPEETGRKALSSRPSIREHVALYRRAEKVIRSRIEEMDRLLADREPARPEEPLAAGREGEADRATKAACQELGITPEQLTTALSPAKKGAFSILGIEINPRPSRNTLYRLSVQWEEGSVSPMMVKRYDDNRISFFSACYRRERGVMELLGRYRCSVPAVFGGFSDDRHALLFLEDVGDDLLAERLEASDEATKQDLLRLAIDGMVIMHSRARWHLTELEHEITKIMKESLSPQYYLDTFRIALQRVLEVAGQQWVVSDWLAIEAAYRPVVDFLTAQPKTFVHFEFTPHNLLLYRGAVTAVDFEQATLGPPEFDLVTLLKCPENDLSPQAIEQLIDYYISSVQELEELAVGPSVHEVFDYANLFKSMFYAGAAANFYRKFGNPAHLARCDWYLRDGDQILARHERLAQLRGLLSAKLEPIFSRGGKWVT